jgi:hypothetical protein
MVLSEKMGALVLEGSFAEGGMNSSLGLGRGKEEEGRPLRRWRLDAGGWWRVGTA